MADDIHILWYRQDLRIADQAALLAAAEGTILPIYILDDAAPGAWAMGAAQRWWLHHSLAALQADLADLGAPLVLRRGDAVTVLKDLAVHVGAVGIHATRHFEPHARRQEKALEEAGIGFQRHRSGYLNEPGAVATNSGTPYKVFTPYWRACQALGIPEAPAQRPTKLNGLDGAESDVLDDWGLLPTTPDWSGGLQEMWTPGEAGAHARLDDFTAAHVRHYKKRRDLPAEDGTSQLSPHLHFGELSAQQIWDRLASKMEMDEAELYVRQLGWRDFSVTLLTHAPDLAEESWSPKFRDFPWREDAEALRRWQTGQTGYPIVDAGMRQLWQTGWMHNRVRMIVASFLCKHLLLHWRHGEDWFWDTLVDADLANNAAGWQWVAGSGADASPYFRIFNPITQSDKFDKDGEYIRTYVPELADLPIKYLHQPWTADEITLKKARVVLGKNYPKPMVDHSAARVRALSAYDQIKAA